MILRSIRLEGIRRFRNPVEITGLGVGAHVIYAPNETGKSTLFTAVARALCDKYSTRGSEIEELRPWGTSLSPTVTLELEAAGKRYRLHKRFLDGAESVIEEWTGNAYERLADAQQADDLMRSFIDGVAPGRGASSISHWGLAQLLWVPQDPSRHLLPGITEPLRQRLLALVGAATLGPKEQDFTERIGKVFAAYFSPKGQPRKGNAIAEVEQKRSDALAEVANWKEAEERASALTEELAGTETELAGFAAETTAQAAALIDIKARANAEAELERQLAAKQGEWTQLKGQFASIESHRTALVALGEKIDQAREFATGLAPEVERARLDADARAVDRQNVGAARDAAKTELEAAEQSLERVRSIEKALRWVGDRRRLEEVLAKADRIAALLTKKKADASRPAPTEAEVKKAEAIEKQIAEFEVRLEAVGLEVAFTPASTAAVTWRTPDGQEQKRPKGGDRAVFRGANAGSLTIAGVGVVEIRSGAQDVSRLKEDLVDRQGDLTRRLAEREAKDVAHLREMLDAAKTREQEVASLEEKLADVLSSDHEDLDSVRDVLRKVSGELAELLAHVALEEADLEGEKGVDARQLIERVKTAKKRLAACEDDSKKADGDLRDATKKHTEIEKERAGHEREAKTLDAQRAAAIAANGTLKSLTADAIRVGGEAALAEAACKAFELKLPPLELRAAAQQQRIEDALAKIARNEKDSRDRFSRGQAHLERAGADGAYSRLCEAEEKVALLDAELAREQRKAAGAKLLSTLVETLRQKASRSLVDPVEKEVRTRLDYLRGPAAQSVELAFSEGLSEVEVAPPGGATMPFQALSWGAQEQMMFALRLAVGAMLSRDGKDPQLVVLDDALVNTDLLRHVRALDLVQSAAEHMQVVILTAFPDRYRALKAQQYDLGTLARGPEVEAVRRAEGA